MEMALSLTPEIVCMTGEGLILFEFGSDSDFSNIYTIYNTGDGSEPEKKTTRIEPVGEPLKMKLQNVLKPN